MIKTIEESILASIDVKRELLKEPVVIDQIRDIALAVIETYKNGGKVLLCGNGGSAADAQHIAAELTGRFKMEREPLNAEALHVNSSYMTAICNDYSFDVAYSRLVKAFGKKGDVLIAISTSGNSKNIINALEMANETGMIAVGFTGRSGGKMKNHCKYILQVPSDDTPRIQETHILLGHIICDIVEKTIFGK
jgi:D-sedoheptulose 7-phosphate isomerase